MKRRTKRAAARAHRKAQREAGMKHPGGRSRYARKHEWLKKHQMHGWEVLEPKPWR